MPIAKSHGNPKKEDRKTLPSIVGGGTIMATDRYNAVENVVDQVYADIASGVSRTEIHKKLKECAYEGQRKPLKKVSRTNYYNAALERFRYDKDLETDKLREVFYGRFEGLFKEAVAKGDIYNANNILQSMCKIFGLEQKAPQTAIQINGSNDGKVVVNFGFNDDNNGDTVQPTTEQITEGSV